MTRAVANAACAALVAVVLDRRICDDEVEAEEAVEAAAAALSGRVDRRCLAVPTNADD